MAGEIREKVVISGDSADAVRATKKLDVSLAATMAAAQLGAAAATKAFGFLTKSIGDAFKNAEANLRSTEKLSAALRQQGQSVQVNLGALNAQSSALQTLTGVSDDVIRSMQATGLAMGATTQNVDELVRAAFSLANATDMDVNAAMRGLSQALAGNAQSLARYLPQVRELTKEQLESGEAARLVNREMGEFLDINTRGLPGQLTRLGNAWEDLGEALVLAAQAGETIPRIIDNITKSLNQLVAVQGSTGAGLLELFLGKAATALGFNAFGEALANAERMAELDQQIADIEAQIAQRRRGFQPQAQTLAAPAAARGPDPARAAAREIGAVGAAGGALDFDALGPESPMATQAIFEQGTAIQAQAFDDRFKLRKEGLDKEFQLLQQQQQREKALIDQGTRAISDFIVGGVQALIEGADFGEFTKNFLKSVGSQIIGQGIQNLLQAAAYAATPFLAPFAPGLAAIGAKQLATGAAMAAGSLAIPGGGGRSGTAASSGRGGGGRFEQGGGNVPPIRSGQTTGNVVNVNFGGRPFVTRAEIGYEVRRAIQASDAQFGGG